MNDTHRITYHNLRDEAARGILPTLVGREEEMERLERLLGRRVNNNLLIVGPDGIGKTTLFYGWVRRMVDRGQHDNVEFLQFDVNHLYELEHHEDRYLEALATMPACILFIDDFGREACESAQRIQRIHRLYKRLLQRADVRIVLTLEAHEHSFIQREFPAFLHPFETMVLKPQPAAEQTRILAHIVPRVNAKSVIVPERALDEIVALSERFPALGQAPKSAVRVLDEALSVAAARGARVLESDTIAQVIQSKTGIPKARLAENELSRVRDLETDLNERVLGQEEAIAKIAKTLQRAKLGLRNPNRPLGSFLLLGPSGVGKTETAKSIAEILFGRAENFARFDMSEFQQEHTVQRLVGAPAGYVGFQEGGALTNFLRKEPHSLVLLDEIEKAHPKVFDIFLQVLDDGRLTSGQNETVDARNAIFMATSNAAVNEILDGYDPRESDRFITEHVIPALAKTFRLEFINRFDAIVVFKPLTLDGLMQIARLEMRKIEHRLERHHVRFDLDPHTVQEKIATLADPRFGARPVKRFIEETCETLIADTLLNS